MAASGGLLLAPYSGVIRRDGYAVCDFSLYSSDNWRIRKRTRFTVASLIVGLAGAFTAYFIPDLSLAINMLMLLFFLIVKPTGLVGEKG